MNGDYPLELTNLGLKFQAWLRSAVARMSPMESDNIHIDELTGDRADARIMCETASRLFHWVQENCGAHLNGMVVMLMVPLQNTPTLEKSIPCWRRLHLLLSHTPPSIYVMPLAAYVQHDPAQRYVALMDDTPHDGDPGVSVYYQCRRNGGDPVEEGWSRDVRAVCLAFAFEAASASRGFT